MNAIHFGQATANYGPLASRAFKPDSQTRGVFDSMFAHLPSELRLKVDFKDDRIDFSYNRPDGKRVTETKYPETYHEFGAKAVAHMFDKLKHMAQSGQTLH